MTVRVVSKTAPSIREAITPEEFIVYCARVSSPHRQEDHASAPKLLRYLIEHEHWSPFEMAHVTMEIETSRAIAAQILRHRSFAFQEFSQRYAEAPHAITYRARRQDTKNRQNSIDDLDEETQQWFRDAQSRVHESSALVYKRALELGIAKECARMLLPLSTRTRLYMSGSIRSWIHYIQVRTHESTQLEHREIAEQCREALKALFPAVAEAVGW